MTKRQGEAGSHSRNKKNTVLKRNRYINCCTPQTPLSEGVLWLQTDLLQFSLLHFYSLMGLKR